MAPVRRATPAQRRYAAALRRDGALSRLSTITAAVGVATIVAVGILGVYVGKALPGHNAAATTSGGTSSGTAGQVSGDSGNSGNSGNSGQGAINPPSTPTQRAPAPAPVTSGSS
jgi:hypothetical protein